MSRDTKSELKEALSNNTWLIGQIEAKDKEIERLLAFVQRVKTAYQNEDVRDGMDDIDMALGILGWGTKGARNGHE